MPNKLHYRPVGIALESHTDSEGRQFVSYKEALRANGHDSHTQIHFLKIDVEGAEFEVCLVA